MDQPTTPPSGDSWDRFILAATGIIAALGSWLIKRARVKSESEKNEDEAAAVIVRDNIGWSGSLRSQVTEEIGRLRSELAEVRREARADVERERLRADEEQKEREDWQERAMACESRVPFLEDQIERLKARVIELEKQIADLKGHRRGPR